MRIWLTAALMVIPAIASAQDDLVARGDYLVNTVMACGNCHTPMGPNGPMMDKALSGGLRFNEPVFDVVASNITMDEKTGIGAWSDDEIKSAIVAGRRPDGTHLAPIMPSTFYEVLSARDLDAIVAYLRTVPAVGATHPAPVYKVKVEAHAFPGADKPIDEAAREADPVVKGFYLATIAHCMECHTARENGVPDPIDGLGAGGMEFPGPWGVSVAANITPSVEHGIGGWTDEEVLKAITDGVGPDGTPLKPPMGYPYYKAMHEDDLRAIVAWLRTIPARP